MSDVPDADTEVQDDQEDIELPINILGRADVAPYMFNGFQVAAIVLQIINTESGQTVPVMVFCAPEDAMALGRRLVSVASPLKPVKAVLAAQQKESK